MKYVYPAVFKSLGNDQFGVRIPSLPGCITEGNGLSDAIAMARDAAAMWLCMAEDSHELPPPAQAVDFGVLLSDEFTSLIDIDTIAYRVEHDNRAVKKTLTIPSWLNSRAEREGINFSQILQAALKEKLGMIQNRAS